jgi:hypothetical protein
MDDAMSARPTAVQSFVMKVLYEILGVDPINRCHSACKFDPLSRGIGVQN